MKLARALDPPFLRTVPTFQTATRSQFRELGHTPRFWCFFVLFLVNFGTILTWGEGSDRVMAVSEGVPFRTPNAHDVEPRMIFESRQISNHRTVGKRSFHRACKRASIHGITWYKGSWYTAKQLGVQMCSNPPNQLPLNVAPPKALQRRRLTCFSWNCGGLPPAHWDFMMMWIEKQAFDIILLQETHWPFSRDWMTDKYMVVHSGLTGKQAGLMCMISLNVCAPNAVSWHESIPGRLLHIRIHGIHNNIDIINIYQHTCKPAHMERRGELWSNLCTLLSSLSSKNVLVLAGDFNCSADHASDAIGYATFCSHGQRRKGTQHPDSNVLLQLLKQFSLQALNTWDSAAGPTYSFNSQQSRIDFICGRHAQADRLARDVKQLTDFPLLPLSGAHHIPLVASLRRDWFPAPHAGGHGWNRQQRLRLHQHCAQRDATFELFNAQVNDAVKSLLAQNAPDLQVLHNTLLTFPGKTFQPQRPLTVFRTNDGLFKCFQEHTQKLRKVQTPDLAGLFQAWFHAHHRQEARREMTLAAKMSRKQKLNRIFETAARAEQSQDHFMLFQTIRELAPKQPLRRIMLRSAQGDLLGPVESAEWLKQWFQAIYSDDFRSAHMESFAWPFTSEDFIDGLKSLPTHKALAPCYAPAPFWKFGAETITEYLTPLFHEFCEHLNFPPCWSKGTLALLVKPGKKGQNPADLRPIALLEPTGKVLMGLVANAIKTQISHVLHRHPQFAYLSGRGTDDAIHRIAHHCREVRQLLSSFDFPVHRQCLGQECPELRGGLLLCLDLTRAFDAIRRDKLFQSLSQLGVSSDLINLLKGIYEQTSYDLTHRDVHVSFATERGIRQGCKAAPLLWAITATALLQTIAQEISYSFMLHNLTLYADDFCAHKIFTSEAELTELIVSLGRFMDIIADAGLELNLNKTTVTLRMKGVLHNKMMHRYVVRNQQGAFLKIPRRDGSVTLVKLVKSFRYLGVCISYYNFEKDTMLMRIKHSEQVSQQLHRWLFSSQSMSIRQKMKLWLQCTFTCLRYGIIATGFNEQTLLLLFQFCLKQWRRLYREPTYITRTSHISFLESHHLLDPLLRLRQLCEQTASRYERRQTNIAADDILHLAQLPDFTALIQAIDAVHAQLRSADSGVEALDLTQIHICPHCDHRSATQTALRRHLTVAHGDRSGMLRQLHGPQYNVPTCPRCCQHFFSWSTYRYHIQYICLAPCQEIEHTEHRLRVQELLRYARATQVADLCRNDELVSYFTHHCSICGRFVSTQTGLMRHWQADHSRAFADHAPVLMHYNQHVDTGNPCKLCTTSYTRTHQCIFSRQLAMLLTELNIADQYCDVAAHDKLCCKHCGKAYTTKHGLAQHVRRFHEAEEALGEHNWDTLQARCHIDQAVQQRRCEDLLTDPQVLHFVSNQCFACMQSFQRRAELLRHLRHSHGSEWNQIERMAMEIVRDLNLTSQCFCIPAQHTAKHNCLIFLQYSLARLLQDREQQPAADGLPPDMMLTTTERVEQLMWFGYGKFIYKLPSLKLALTLHCQICGVSCRTGDDMVQHLYQMHSDLIAEHGHILQLIRWMLFQAFGCACNPSRGYGATMHICPALIQMALISAMAHWPVVLPWTFRTNEILSFVGDLLPLEAFGRIGLLLLTRRFERLWTDPDLIKMLKNYCVICGESVPFPMIKAHLRVMHRVGENELHAVLVQLCQVYTAEHSEAEHCDHCGELLPTYHVEDFQSAPELHLIQCPLLIQMAVFLMHPILHKEPFDPDHWPSHQAIAAAHQHEDLQKMLFNAGNSDTAGQDYDLVVACGLCLLQDRHVNECIKFQCLCCQKSFFGPGNLIRHLHDHNYKQMNTMWCYKRLSQHIQPCSYCGSTAHDENSHCTALLNLAVHLTNGRRSRQCEFHLEGSFDRTTTPGTGTQRREEGGHQQATQKAWSIQYSINRYFGESRSFAPPGGSHGDPPRIDPPGLDSGVRVPGLYGHGGRECHPNHASDHERLASGHQGSDASSHSLPDLHRNPHIEAGEAMQSASHRCSLHRLPEIQLGGCRPQHAIPEMGPNGQEADSEQGEEPADWRSPEHPGKCGDNSEIRTSDHTSVSCSVQPSEGEREQPLHPLPLDGGTSDAGRAVESATQNILSQHLAACEVDLATAESAENRPDEADPRDFTDDKPKFLVRILMNDTGTVCYANATLLALLWCTLLVGGLQPANWTFGYEMMRGACQWTPVPLHLIDYQPFLWLLCGDWTIEDLRMQQDILEFCTFLLSRLQPKFLSCSWCTRFQYVTGVSHPSLDSEKGTQHAPILIRFIDHQAPACELQDLISHWHDTQGLCRASDQEHSCLVLMFDRHIEGLNQKCVQRIDIGANQISFPCFLTAEGDIHMKQYDIAAITFHLGNSPNSGHHRTALRYHGFWLIYDDNRLPDKQFMLSDLILSNLTMIWLVDSCDRASRTMHEHPEHLSGLRHTMPLISSSNAGNIGADETSQSSNTAVPTLSSATTGAGDNHDRLPLPESEAVDTNATHVHRDKRARTAASTSKD